MPPSPRRILADFLGAVRLGADGVASLAGVVEHMHHDALPRRRAPGGGGAVRLRGIAGAVYGGVRRTARFVGGALATATPVVDQPVGADSTPRRDAAIAALNGIMGDHLAATGNPLALSMRLLYDGHAVHAADLPRNGRVLLLVHGLCMGPGQWHRKGHDHGTALARDCGFAPVYVQYNSGLHVADNGSALADALETMLHAWPVPVEEIVIVAHSMGGLVARSAVHQATLRGHAWPNALRRIAFLATPHHGSHLERSGQRLHLRLRALPLMSALSRLGELRSAGITDLRHGNLLHEDRAAGADRFTAHGDTRQPVPLPPSVECHAFAAVSRRVVDTMGESLIGDGLVPVPSALGEHSDPAFDLGLAEAQRWIGRGMNHFDLLHRPEVYAEIRARLGRRR